MGSVWEPQFDTVGEGHKVFYGNAAPSLASDIVGLIINPGDYIQNVSPTPSAILGWLALAGASSSYPGGQWAACEAIQSMAYVFTAAQVDGMYAAPLTLVPAQGAGTLIEIVSIVYENVYGSAVYTGGGAIAAYYVNNAGVLASATLAATFLTSPTVNQIAQVVGAIASSAASLVENQAVVLSNAAGAFAAGTGGSLIVRVKYRVHGSLS